MLDQNTDRMWYVIGAVIIGAAIILILNGTAPELFASVADTFSEKTEEVTTVIDNEMGVAESSTNVLAGKTWTDGVMDPIVNGTIRPADNGLDMYIADYIPTYGASSMTITLKEPVTNSTMNYGRVNAYDATKTGIDTPWATILGNAPINKTVELTPGTAYVRVMLIDGDSGAYTMHFNE